ncbi:MAG: hypothetical protein R3F24_02980 [Gammaproteobacteria bacterium]
MYEPRALTHLLEHPAADAILISGATDAGDEVYVEVREGVLLDMSKHRERLGSVAGELVGIGKISAAPVRQDVWYQSGLSQPHCFTTTKRIVWLPQPGSSQWLAR